MQITKIPDLLPFSLFSVFIIPSLSSIIIELAILQISIFYIVSVSEQVDSLTKPLLDKNIKNRVFLALVPNVYWIIGSDISTSILGTITMFTCTSKPCISADACTLE